jgi:hypothetical protein
MRGIYSDAICLTSVPQHKRTEGRILKNIKGRMK